jgi:hypothetical protein
MKHLKSYESFVYSNQELDELNEGTVTYKSFKNASQKLQKGEKVEKLIHIIAKDLTNYKESINIGLTKVMKELKGDKYIDELKKILVYQKALQIITLDQTKLSEMIKNYESLGETKVNEMINNGEIWKFKFKEEYKDKINWEKSMENIREANKKGRLNLTLKQDGDQYVFVATGTKTSGLTTGPSL